MPANIVKELINDSRIGVFQDFEHRKVDAEKLKKQWDQEIEAKRAEVDNLKNKLDEYEVSFNFVGLYQGFSNLREQKKKEAFWLFWSLISMGILVLTPLVIEMLVLIFGLYPLGVDHWLILLPLISIEAILIYFFRIILLNYKSAKVQIMQIELRQALCQFIQSYVEYSTKIKEHDAAALEKFENLIFSGLLTDSEKLPSTYDGMEQIGNLIKSMKAPK